MEFGVLGPLGVREAGATIAVPPGAVRALLAHLLIRPNRVVASDDLIDALWGDDAPRTARNVLQAHVAHLRRELRAGGAEAAERVETKGSGYRIRVEAGELDADVFAAEVTEARRRQRTNPVAAADLLRHALGLWRGLAFEDADLLPGSDGGAIARLDDVRLGALETQAELDLRIGRVADVIANLELVVAEHPYRERFHALLMLALYRAGRQADALDVYRRVRHVLVEELGVEPGPELRALQLAVLRQDRDLTAANTRIGRRGAGEDGPEHDSRHGETTDDVDDPGPTVTPNNLPVELTPFIGRDRELARLLHLFQDERLVTVTGVGGTGKTRFARQAASLALESFPGGAWFVDLTPVPDGDRVLPTVAAAIGASEQGGRSLHDAVVAAIGQRRVLLVVDNCEHVIDASARLIDGLLRAVPGLTVLATSREPLRLSSEALFRLVPLPVAVNDTPRADLLATDAVRLFLDRAGRVRSVDALSDDDVATIGQICRRLDGLPLALEMAAARLRVLSPRDVLERLEDRFGLLTDGGRTATERHQTIRATLDWSHDMLEAPDRATLRRMSVFATAVPAAAVEAVCGGGEVTDPLESAMRLADRSLVVANVGADGRTRFGLLDTVREYGRVHLRSVGEEAATFGRHIAYWTAIAERAHELRFEDPNGQAAALEAVLGETRVALDRAHVLDPPAETRLAARLGWFWESHSHLVEGRALLDRALSVGDADAVDRARALAARGAIKGVQGDSAPAIDDIQAALATWRDRADRVEECATLDMLGWAAFWAGEDATAGAAFEAGLQVATDIGHPSLVRRNSSGLCQVLVAIGDVERARPLAEEILRIAGDDIRTEHFGHHFLADCDLITRDGPSAREGYRRALELAIRMGDAIETILEIEGVGMASAGCGDPELALRLGGSAAAAYERLEVEIGAPFWLGFRDRWYGMARVALGPTADDAWDRGRATSIEDASRDALGAVLAV